MDNALVERYIESAVEDAFNHKAARLMKVVNKIAAKQGGGSTIENYKLLGKRVLIVLGVTVVAVQATTSVIGLVVSRKSEEQRIEKVVHRVLEEERQNAAEAASA